jgi:hypothetical protein
MNGGPQVLDRGREQIPQLRNIGDPGSMPEEQSYPTSRLRVAADAGNRASQHGCTQQHVQDSRSPAAPKSPLSKCQRKRLAPERDDVLRTALHPRFHVLCLMVLEHAWTGAQLYAHFSGGVCVGARPRRIASKRSGPWRKSCKPVRERCLDVPIGAAAHRQ